ncbi:MAG: hypothetical protein NZ473_08575, partial [Candidatus Kapabacteria bacterium]|nr:hypothetical protein [Candidatus Kapabacteria bacterium]MDW8225186.1 hypothetical protein [Bacteroidota bacterium]
MSAIGTAVLLGTIISTLPWSCLTPLPTFDTTVPVIHQHPWYSTEHHLTDKRRIFRNLEPSLPRPFWPSFAWIVQKLLI